MKNRVCPGVSRCVPGTPRHTHSGGGVPIIPLGGMGITTHGRKTPLHAGCKCTQVFRTHRDTPEKTPNI